mgnify:CR=1 FL=1
MAVDIKQNELKNMTPAQRLSNAKKKERVKITAPILKRRKVVEKTPEIVLPEYNFDDFTKLSVDDQTELFNAIKNVFVKLREDAEFMDTETFEHKYYGNLYEVFNLAVTGNVAAMDFLCYAYKKGMEDGLPVNLTFAHKWGMLAIENGSKLSVDRMRMFLTPVFEYIEYSDIDLDRMMERYDVPDGEAIYFVAETFAGIYNPKMNISLLQMSKENPGDNDSNFQKFIFEANKKRQEILPEVLKYLEY